MPKHLSRFTFFSVLTFFVWLNTINFGGGKPNNTTEIGWPVLALNSCAICNEGPFKVFPDELFIDIALAVGVSFLSGFLAAKFAGFCLSVFGDKRPAEQAETLKP